MKYIFYINFIKQYIYSFINIYLLNKIFKNLFLWKKNDNSSEYILQSC